MVKVSKKFLLEKTRKKFNEMFMSSINELGCASEATISLSPSLQLLNIEWIKLFSVRHVSFRPT